MRKYNAMPNVIKAVTVFALFVLLEAGYSAERSAAQPKNGAAPGAASGDIYVRSSQHEGFARIVFEGPNEAVIRNISVTSSQGRINVQFPDPPNLITRGSLNIEASLRGSSYVIKPEGPFTIKVLKLTSPPRLSIDIMKSIKEEDRKPAPSEKASKKEEGRKIRTEGLSSEAIPNLRIVLDPGHGGYDLGILSGDLREKDVTVAIAKDIEAMLIKRGMHVSLTRKSDQFLSIIDRAMSASQRPPDIFISIHLSLTDFVLNTLLVEPVNPEAPAAEFYSLMSRQKKFVEKSRSLAESLGKTIKDEFKNEIVLRDMRLPLLSFIGAPAVLIEIPAAIAYDLATRARLSEAILKGISSYANR